MTACSTASPSSRLALPLQAALVAAQFLALGLLMGSWATGLPALKARFGYSAQELSGVLLAVAAGSVLAFLSCARLMQAVGPRHFIRATGPLAAYAMLTTLLVDDSLPLAVIAFVFGWASAAFDVAINGSAVTLERLHGRSLMSKLHAMFSSGGVLAAGATAGLAWSGLHPLWLAVPVALLMSALSLCTPAMPALAADTQHPAGVSPAAPRPWRLGFAALLCLLCEGTMYDWSSVYMTQVWQTPLFLSVAGFGLFSAAMAAGRFGGDRLRDRFGAPLLLLGGCTIAAAGALLCVFGHSRELALLGFVLVGLGLSNVIPIVFALAPAAHVQAPERAIAFVSGTGFIGFLIGPPLIGLWTTLASFDTSLLLVCAAALGTAVLAGRR